MFRFADDTNDVYFFTMFYTKRNETKRNETKRNEYATARLK
jgi:hypothetical protein